MGVKDIIKSILREYHGHQTDIDELAPLVTDKIIDGLKDYLPTFQPGVLYHAMQIIHPEDPIKTNIRIFSINVEVEVKRTNNDLITGQFYPNRNSPFGSEYYQVFMKLVIEISDDNLLSRRNKILSVIAHELNHAFKSIKTNNKKSKSSVYGEVGKAVKMDFMTVLRQYPPLQEFMNMFYLTLSDEIAARVQQTYTELQTIESDNVDDTMRQLLQFNPLNDAKKMMHYNIDSIMLIDYGVLNHFLQVFNTNLKHYVDRSNVDVKVRQSINGFFEYWEDVVKINGFMLYRKILKLVSDKHIISEIKLFNHIDRNLMNEIVGDADKVLGRFDND